MAQTGVMACAEKLLQPARRVLKDSSHIRREPFERRVALWNSVKSNYDRYLQEDCGIFLEEVDLHIRSMFDAALAALASACIENGEEFPPVSLYSEEEIHIWQRVERFNILEFLSQEDVRNRILRKDADLLSILEEYYLTMDRYVDQTIENPDIRLTLRYYLKRRWNGYRGKIDAAIADAVTKFDWMQHLVASWEEKNDR